MAESSHQEEITSLAKSPLDPLAPSEMELALLLVREAYHFGPQVRFLSVALREPAKEDVLAYQAGGADVKREVEIIVLDPQSGTTFVALVSLAEKRALTIEERPGIQPSISFEEIMAVEVAVKADPAVQEALAYRGITDLDLVMVDSWPTGYYGPEDDPDRRLGRPLIFVKMDQDDNGYAHPVEGLDILVDLNALRVINIEDHGALPIPSQRGNYTLAAIGESRPDLKPIEITQPEGPGFQVRGQEVSWQNWSFRLGWSAREGLILYTISYNDHGRIRPILYRASLAEMIVSYGDPSPLHYRRNVLDMGEHGLGVMANALELGCDCVGHIHYFDAHITNMQGKVVTLPNAICLHEEDAGVLWKHTDFRTNKSELRRSRRLVVSFFATVGIYDYGFFWYFYQDGSIEFEVKLTGIMSTRGMPAGEKPKYGQLVAPDLCAIIHQHFFCVRVDTMVDGRANSVYEVHVEAEPEGPSNPYGNAFFAVETRLETEQEAQQVIDPLSGRFWKVVNPKQLNYLGEPVAYKLVPQDNAVALARREAQFLKRAQFITKNLWVTPAHPEERYPAGDFPNQHSGGAGLPQWTQANRSIVETDLVLWYTLGMTHVPRLEEWPVMPVTKVGFALKPAGFFERNPALDVPPP